MPWSLLFMAKALLQSGLLEVVRPLLFDLGFAMLFSNHLMVLFLSLLRSRRLLRIWS